MKFEFEETYAAPGKRYSVGVESTSGSHCVSIPASSGKPDDFEYYEITRDQYREFLFDHRKALQFVEACRNQEHDGLLMRKPGAGSATPE